MGTRATEEYVQEAEELLLAAEVDLTAGKEQEGARKAWNAAACASKAALEPLGWPCDSYLEMRYSLERLEKETGVKDLSSGLSTADCLRTQAEYGFMYEGDGVEVDFPLLQKFVAQILDLAAPDRPQSIVPEGARKARELMDDVHFDFIDGAGERASERMWQAVCYALKAVAQQRGWPSDTTSELGKVADQLARETGDKRFISGFVVAETYFANYDTDFFSDEHDDYARPLVRRFVIRILHRLA